MVYRAVRGVVGRHPLPSADGRVAGTLFLEAAIAMPAGLPAAPGPAGPRPGPAAALATWKPPDTSLRPDSTNGTKGTINGASPHQHR